MPFIDYICFCTLNIFWCSGIGIVNAIEVIRAFPEEDGLQIFREWVESPDPSILGKFNTRTGSNIKKRSIKSSNKDGDGTTDNPDIFPSEESVSKAHENQSSLDDILHIKEVFMSKHVSATCSLCHVYSIYH